MNQIQAIKDGAKQEARARKEHDESRAHEAHRHTMRMIRLEDNPVSAMRIYTEAYREESGFKL